jgi:hypothetical protein
MALFEEYSKNSSGNNLDFRNFATIQKNCTELNNIFPGLGKILQNCADMKKVRKEFREWLNINRKDFPVKKEFTDKAQKGLNLVVNNPQILISGTWFDSH